MIRNFKLRINLSDTNGVGIFYRRNNYIEGPSINRKYSSMTLVKKNTFPKQHAKPVYHEVNIKAFKR